MRDYGMFDPTPYLDGTPKVVEEAGPPCPKCGADKIFIIEVRIKDFPFLPGGKGIGTYMGCPACTFATPMAMMVMAEEEVQ